MSPTFLIMFSEENSVET